MIKFLLRKLFYSCMLFAICHMVSGCATMPVGETIATYNIRGKAYIPLSALCDANRLGYQHETFTQVITLD
ncbi:MAG: hypothetical protein AB1481_03800, partial [Candidatus Omnitrophota bacterium]